MILPATWHAPWHAQLYWPFGWWVSFEAVQQDSDIRLEVGLAAVALLAAVGMVVLALRARRLRVPALVVLGAAIWVGAPHLRPVLVPAGPYTFYRSPTGFTAASIADGARLFPTHCAGCHGAAGRGDGPMAGGLPVPPADLTAPHLWMHSDGELFGWLTDGIPAPDGSPAMPGFAAALTPDQRWHLIDYIRAHNGGRICQPTVTPSVN
jgi:mono/diheme cytochrome c family protein